MEKLAKLVNPMNIIILCNKNVFLVLQFLKIVMNVNFLFQLNQVPVKIVKMIFMN